MSSTLCLQLSEVLTRARRECSGQRIQRTLGAAHVYRKRGQRVETQRPEQPRRRNSLAEVSARLRVLLRRIDLRPKEYALLEFLMRHGDRPLTRALIIEHVWDIHFDSISNVVEVHINALRHKIDRDSATALIHTVRGVGYMLSDKAP